tara:strand:+ start:3727 stop:4632 length:906 start_codon:yes stop_codon:yes gene_type:complete
MESDNHFELNNVLFYGGSSLLAHMWTNTFMKKDNIFLTKHIQEIKNKGCQILHVANAIDEKSLISMIKKNRIRFIVNCVGLTNVEKCENDLQNANYLNSLVPQILAKVCNYCKIKFIHISTDHLFDGENPFSKESGITKPLNLYAQSKLHGEQNVLKEKKDSLIIRTNFFGNGPGYNPSFSDKIINSIINKREIVLFEDVFFTPIHIREFSRIVNILVERNFSGIYNVVCNERISKYEFGVLISEILNLPNQNLKKGKLLDRKDLSKRPLDMSLSNLKLKNLVGINVLPIRDQIRYLNKCD